MQMQMQVTFRGMDPSPALEAAIRERVEKLDQFHPNITGCRVTVEKPHHHKHQGEHFVVTLDLTVPGTDLVVNHAHAEDANVALRDAFMAARRQLEEHARKKRGEVKAHSRAGKAAGEDDQ